MLNENLFCPLQRKLNDPDVMRLLGEVKYQLKDYDGSVRAYKTSAMVRALHS